MPASRISYTKHAEALASQLWKVGCCTPGLYDRLFGRAATESEHSDKCNLGIYLKEKHRRKSK